MRFAGVGLAIAALGLLGLDARAAGTCVSITGSTSLVQAGIPLNFAANCCTAVPALPDHRWLLGGLLLLVGALFIRPRRRGVSGLLLWAVFNSFALPARGESCGPPFQWKAQSPSETFVGTGTGFSFTPTHAGTFTVSLSDPNEMAAVSIQVVDQQPQIVSLTPASASTTPGGTITFVVSFDVPTPVGGSTVLLALNPVTGTVPATVFVPTNQLSATFEYVDGGQGTAAMVTAMLGTSFAVATISIAGNTCPPLTHLVISEIRSRGAGGASDEFVEFYNPTSASITLDSSWKLDARSNAATSFSARWVGTGKVIPAHGHFLIAGTAYTQAPAADEALSTGITDASAVRLTQSEATVDILCYGFDAPSAATFGTDVTYGCEGTPVATNPHNNVTSTNRDASLDRKPGAAAGNCTDTGDNAADFQVSTPANPQDIASPPTP